MKVPEFLSKDEVEVTSDALLKLERLVEQFKFIEEDIEDLEARLKDKKKFFNKLSQEEIPNLLGQYGLSEIKLKNGAKVIVKEDASVSVPTVKEKAFYDFLHERDEEDIIKMYLAFDKMEQEAMKELFEFLTEHDYAYSAERKVHSQTLKKYFKELLGIGDENRELGIKIGTYMRKEDIEDIANVFTYFKTKIK